MLRLVSVIIFAAMFDAGGVFAEDLLYRYEGDMLPYDILRKMLKTFGAAQMAQGSFRKAIAREKERQAALERGEQPEEREKRKKSPEELMKMINTGKVDKCLRACRR